VQLRDLHGERPEGAAAETSTVSPRSMPDRHVTAIQAPRPVLPSAAAVTSSMPSSTSNSAVSRASAFSAIDPNGWTVSSK